MATKLEKPVTREVTVTVDGVEGALNVTLTTDGVSVRGKGTKRELTVSYATLASVAEAPEAMPKKFADNKLAWLVDRKAKTESAE